MVPDFDCVLGEGILQRTEPKALRTGLEPFERRASVTTGIGENCALVTVL